MATHELTNEIIAAAIDGFEALKQRIDAQIAELRGSLNGASATEATTSATPRRKKRRLSAAGRKAIAEAARRRWAAVKAETKAHTPAAKKAPREKVAKRAVTKRAAKGPAKATE